MDESNVVINEFTPSNIIEYDNKLSNEIIETINQNYNNSKSGQNNNQNLSRTSQVRIVNKNGEKYKKSDNHHKKQ